MKRSGSQLIVYVLWRAAKWYLRRRLPSTRTLAKGGIAGLSALVLVAVLARRLGG